MSFSVSVNREVPDLPVITLTAANGTQADIFAYGGLLNKFSLNGGHNIIDAYDSPKEAIQQIKNGFHSAKLSPFVCRLNRGKYQFSGINYQIDKHFIGIHAIHGLLFDATYTIIRTHQDENHCSVELAFQYKGNDNGYPFPYDITIEWTLSNENKLTAKTSVMHNHKKAIPFQDGWHPYFKLGGSVNNWTLQFDSKTLIAFDDTLLPTGEKKTCETFLNPVKIGELNLDNCFELDQTYEHPGVVLENESLKLRILPDKKTYPYIQVYIPEERQSIAIENLSGAPDGFNNHMGLCMLEPGHPFSYTTSYILNAL